jgi:Na+-transporting NADH:ubiquinone oxidoreductase subunit A
MSTITTIKKGLDIKLVGEAEKTITEVQAKQIAIKPTDFTGVFPKMLVKEGAKVKAGSPIFFDKYRDNIVFTSPVGGVVSEIKRGAKRKLLEVKIEVDAKGDFEDFGAADPTKLNKESVTEKLLKSGLWPFIKQRPYSVIANPDDNPKSIFISGFDNNPLAPDYDFILHGKGEAYQAGLDAISKLTSGKVNLNIHADNSKTKVLLNSKNVQINQFKGKYPSGMVGPQIAALDPLNKGEVVWVINPQDVITIGQLFLTGKIDAEKIIAITGSEVLKPRYIKTSYGVCVKDILADNVTEGDIRFISGNPLTGEKIDLDGHLGAYHNQITVLPEGRESRFIGWILPNFDVFSYYKSMFSWLTPGKKYKLNTNMNGGERAFVVTGKFEEVFPFDIYPMQLIKAVMAEDIDKMEQLGIYEVEAEDFALLEFISTSKIEIQSVIANGLEFLRKELS